MIAMGDLLRDAKMRLVLALDMDRGQYQNSYRSETYPRLQVAKDGTWRNGRLEHTTTYFVDDIEVPDLDAALVMLNTEPHPKRTDMMRHQQGDDNADTDGDTQRPASPDAQG